LSFDRVQRVIDPDRVRERWLALEVPAVVAQLVSRCERRVVRWVDHPGVEMSRAHPAHPHESLTLGEDPTRRLPAGEARIGLDGEERAVVIEFPRVAREHLTRDGDRVEVVRIRGGRLESLRCYRLEDGRVAERVDADGAHRLDGRPRVIVWRWHESGDETLVVEAYESADHPSYDLELGPYWGCNVYRHVRDQGELSLLDFRNGPRPLAPGADADAPHAEALARFPHDFGSPSVIWDARRHAEETDLPAPEQAYEGIAEPLAAAYHRAITAQRGGLGTLEFVVIAPGGLLVGAAGTTFADRASRTTSSLSETLYAALEGADGTVVVDAFDAADAELARRLRAAGQALVGNYATYETTTLQFEQDLAAELAQLDWPDAAATFMPVAHRRSDSDSETDGDGLDDEIDEAAMIARWKKLGLSPDDLAAAIESLSSARRKRPSALPLLDEIVGRDRVDAFAARLGVTGAARDTGDLVVSDRAELARELETAGLTPEQAQRIAADALWGVLLAPGGLGLSRLGGPALFDAEAHWPHAEERPLTHLATIAMNELPAVEGRHIYPDDGLLSFFADLSEEAELWEPVEPGGPGRELFAVIHTPACAAAAEHPPPGEALREQRVQLLPRLQLRHLGFGSGEERFGLDPLAEAAVLNLTARINGDVPHQLLGFPQPVQDDPREDDQVVLFHIADDPALEFNFLDAGDLHFLGTPDDIRAQRWDALTISPSSC
jgi:uncharacterized protein DUF1963